MLYCGDEVQSIHGGLRTAGAELPVGKCVRHVAHAGDESRRAAARGPKLSLLWAVLVVVDMARKQNKTAREYSVSNVGEVSHLTPLLQENTDAVPPKAAFGPRIRWREKKYFGGRRFEAHRQRMKRSRRGGEFLCNDEPTSVSTATTEKEQQKR